MTTVEFRKIGNAANDIEIVAIFPKDKWNMSGSEIACYMHCGQHSGCSRDWYKHLRFAKEHEYVSLKSELETCYGYKFKVLNRTA